MAVLEHADLDLVRWNHIADKIPNRNGKQCRERWCNHLRPDLKKGDWTDAEDEFILKYQSRIGNK